MPTQLQHAQTHAAMLPPHTQAINTHCTTHQQQHKQNKVAVKFSHKLLAENFFVPTGAHQLFHTDHAP